MVIDDDDIKYIDPHTLDRLGRGVIIDVISTTRCMRMRHPSGRYRIYRKFGHDDYRYKQYGHGGGYVGQIECDTIELRAEIDRVIDAFDGSIADDTFASAPVSTWW